MSIFFFTEASKFRLSDLHGLSQMIKQSAQDSLSLFPDEGWKLKVIYPDHTVERQLEFSAQIFWG